MNARDASADRQPRSSSEPRRTPNVLYVVWDDASIAGWDAFGGLIETPNMKRLAARGLRYSQWHTPARSALTRSCLLTGRDCAGPMAWPGPSSGEWREHSVLIPPAVGSLAEIMAENGYRTYCVEFIRDGVLAAPGQAWLCYLSFGGGGAPQIAPGEWTDKYRGRFETGYDRYREIVLRSMKRLGMVPASTGLAPAEQPPVGDAQADGSVLRPWHSLTDEQRQLSNRGAESYAGLCSFADYQVGRVLDYLEESGQLDDTMVVVCSANATGAVGGNHPAEWARAFRTPYNVLRQHSHGGSVPSPLIISWPREMMDVAGGVRDQYHYAADLVPTILGCAAIDPPRLVKGLAQAPMDGVSMRYTFTAPGAPSVRRAQRYAASGGRAMYVDGWKAVAGNTAPAAKRTQAAGAWELYHVAADRAEIRDVAARYPAKTVELASLWEAISTGLYFGGAAASLPAAAPGSSACLSRDGRAAV